MRRLSAAAGLFLVLALVVTALASTRLTRGAGSPLLPDLRTLPPKNLSLKAETMSDNRSHFLLRFDNTVGNYGGRLEIVADFAKSRDLFQNVYDAYNGGSLVSSTRIDSDLIFHPTHNHFHLQDFATYVLRKKDASGTYQATSRRGTKSSFCIIDTIRVTMLGTGASSFNNCTAQRQGLSAGWADVYTAGLPEQWIDMGTTLPEDGDYAIESTTDPNNKLAESSDSNNSAVTYFSIRAGKLTATVTDPMCTVNPNNGSVGTSVNLSCERLNAGETFNLRWDSPNASILKSITANGQGSASTSLIVPSSTLGPHYVHVTGQTSGQSVLGLFTTNPGLSLASTSGTVERSIPITLSGFAANEKVTVRYTTNGSSTTVLATLTVNANGGASGTGTIPASALGAHKVEAKGGTSKKAVVASYTVVPTMSLNLATVQAGKKVAPTLRGFQKSERVTISIPSKTLTLKTIRTSSSGSANGSSSNSFTIPKDLAPGDYLIQARGTTSGATVTASLKVTATTATTRSVSVSDEEEPDRTATSEPEAEPTATDVPVDTPAATVETAPTATADQGASDAEDDDRQRPRRRTPRADD